MWKEESHNSDTIMNIDVGWCMSLDCDWKLFGGEINCEFDSVALDADSLEEVGWQTVEDDVLSVCSSVTSWSCLHGNNLLETSNGFTDA